MKRVTAVDVGDRFGVEEPAGHRQSEDVVGDGHGAFAVSAAAGTDAGTVGFAPSYALDVAFTGGVYDDDIVCRRIDIVIDLESEFNGES